MNAERLLKLADLLEADAKNEKGIRFDIGTFGETADGDSEPGVNCKTAACAMGLAALSGAFKQDGLTFEVIDLIDHKEIFVKYGDHDGSDAGAKLFEISDDEAEWLFLPSGYESYMRGPQGELTVAQRIRDFVSGKAAP